MYELTYEENVVGCYTRRFETADAAKAVVESEVENCKSSFGMFACNATEDTIEVIQMDGDGYAAWSVKKVA